jgi:superfamily II DNA/RNA helicase
MRRWGSDSGSGDGPRKAYPPLERLALAAAAKRAEVLYLLDTLDFHQSIVFCNQPEHAQKLVDALNGAGFPAALISGALSQSERHAAMRRMHAFHLRVLVATDLLARGVDFGRVTLVLHFAPPRDLPTYLHRVGRTGRFATRGLSVLLLTEEELPAAHAMLAPLAVQVEPLPARLSHAASLEDRIHLTEGEANGVSNSGERLRRLGAKHEAAARREEAARRSDGKRGVRAQPNKLRPRAEEHAEGRGEEGVAEGVEHGGSAPTGGANGGGGTSGSSAASQPSPPPTPIADPATNGSPPHVPSHAPLPDPCDVAQARHATAEELERARERGRQRGRQLARERARVRHGLAPGAASDPGPLDLGHPPHQNEQQQQQQQQQQFELHYHHHHQRQLSEELHYHQQQQHYRPAQARPQLAWEGAEQPQSQQRPHHLHRTHELAHHQQTNLQPMLQPGVRHRQEPDVAQQWWEGILP